MKQTNVHQKQTNVHQTFMTFVLISFYKPNEINNFSNTKISIKLIFYKFINVVQRNLQYLYYN